MAIEGDLRTVLLPVAPNRVFPDFAPGSALTVPVQPFVTYRQEGGKPFNYLDGVPQMRNGRFQINVWASSRLTAMSMIRQIEDLLRASPVLRAVTLTGAAAVYDDPTKLYGAHQDFSIWFR